MKYHILFKGDKADSTGKTTFDTPEAAFAEIPGRAERFGNLVKEYSVLCESDTGPSTVLTTLPIAGTVQLDHNASSANPKQAYGDKKLPVHLVPRALTQEAALNMRDGAEKYGPYNWRSKKVEVMTYLAAIERHLASYLDGEDVDPESKSGATHLGAIAACVGIIADARNTGNLIDNRPPKGKSGEVIRRAAGVVLPTTEEKSK